MTISHKCENCGLEIDFVVTPSTPAPFAQNHDSLAFSDPGDGGDVDGPDNCPECGRKITEDERQELITKADEAADEDE